MRGSDLHRRAILRNVLMLFVSWILAMACSPAARGDQTCASGNLASVVGTTCNIGALQFTFTGVTSYEQTFDPYTETYTDMTPWAASDFTFTRVTNGFTLAFSGGPQPQSVTAPLGADSTVDEYFSLSYNVIDSSGYIVGVGVTGGSLIATGATEWFSGQYGYVETPGDESEAYGTNQVLQNRGVVVTSVVQNGLVGPPISSGSGEASPVHLFAHNGDGAAWDGTPTTFTYDTVPAPERGTSMLLCAGLFSIFFVRRRFLS
jgi:hypothetical protein